MSTGNTTRALPSELSSATCANSIKEAFLKMMNFTFIQRPSQREGEAPETHLEAVFDQHSLIVTLERLPRTSKILYELYHSISVMYSMLCAPYFAVRATRVGSM